VGRPLPRHQIILLLLARLQLLSLVGALAPVRANRVQRRAQLQPRAERGQHSLGLLLLFECPKRGHCLGRGIIEINSVRQQSWRLPRNKIGRSVALISLLLLIND
jgi:hypothetical protein